MLRRLGMVIQTLNQVWWSRSVTALKNTSSPSRSAHAAHNETCHRSMMVQSPALSE